MRAAGIANLPPSKPASFQFNILHQTEENPSQTMDGREWQQEALRCSITEHRFEMGESLLNAELAFAQLWAKETFK